MEKKIKALFYNFNDSDIAAIADEIVKIGYNIDSKPFHELGKLKAEIMNSANDAIVIDHDYSESVLEEIEDFLNDLEKKTSLIIASDNINTNLVEQAFKNNRCDIVSKNNNFQICLSLIRGFTNLKSLEQLDFTKEELLRSHISQVEHGNFLNQVIESTQNPIFYKGLGGRYLGCNNAFAKFLGFPKEEIIGKTVFDVAPKVLAEKYHEMDQAFFKNPVVQEYEFKAAHADGYIMDVLFHKSPLKDENGNIIGLLGHMFKIEKKPKGEIVSWMSDYNYKMLVENMHEGLSVVDLNEKVIICNSTFDKIFGCEPGGMIGKDLRDFMQGDDIQLIKKESEKRKENQSSNYKVRIKRKDGVIRTLNVSSAPWKDLENKIIGTIGLVVDITAQEYSAKRLEKKLKIEKSIINISSQFISTENFNTKLDNVLNEVQNIIDAEKYNIISIQNGKIKLTNESFNSNVSSQEIEFLELPFQDFKYCMDMLETLDFIFFEDVSKLPKDAILEREMFERYKVFNFLGIPFYSGSELAGLISIMNIYDVNEWTLEDLAMLRTISDIVGHAFNRNKAEERVKQLNLDLTTKNDELEQVVYVTSHDIRSPVVNILGFSDEMVKALNKLSDKIFIEANTINNKDEIEYLLNKDIPQILDFIKISGQKIDKLLLALLKLSRLGRAAINKTNVDMNKLLGSVISNFEFRIQQENISIEVSDLPGCRTDEVAINQVFSNLIDNSIKYKSPERDAVIKISGYENEDNITYCIEDNGIGISETEIDKIFDVFYRVNPENQEGEGIGLSLIKKTIERLDGDISLGSEEGKGTKFYISLEKQS